MEDNVLQVESLRHIDEFTQLEYDPFKKGRLILSMLESMELTDMEIDELYSIAISSPYAEVLIYLQEQRGDNFEILRTFLQSDNKEVKLGIFRWIQNKFETLDDYQATQLREDVMDCINLLVEIDSSQTSKLIKEYYQESQESIIDKLENAPKLQIKFIGKLLAEETDEDSSVRDLVMKYIRLLCEYQPENLLDFLCSREDYYFDDVLVLCKNYNITDAIAYLYEKLGSQNQALELIDSIIEDKMNNILD